MKIDKSKMRTNTGMFITQGLFLELEYSPYAMYSLKEYDCEYNGKKYPSIKRLYLEMEDPTEYTFATTYFYSWDHWQRICRNRLVKPYIESWRNELRLKLMAKGFKEMLVKASDPKGTTAAKWLAEGQFDKNPVGRPSKEKVKEEAHKLLALDKEFAKDVKRLAN